MTFNNSLLLLVKHNQGIDFKELLAKITPRYKSPTSAKSALMRALKDMTSFGLIKREGSRIFITDKGLASMSMEMKDKLVIRLNEEIKKPLGNLEEIVRLLVVLSQRGAQDKDLLNNAKENASFTIHDLDELRSKIRAQRKHLKKMSFLLETQAEKLKELDFNDSVSILYDASIAAKFALFCSSGKVVVETKDQEVLSKIPDHWKKQEIITVEGENISLLAQLLASIPSAKATLYAPGLRVSLMAGKSTFFGSHKKIKEFLDLKVGEVPQKVESAPVQGTQGQTK
ncbi:MAG: hypothetical protein WCW44_00360 [archaeon]|jgi:hypothetical protein